MPPRRHSPGSSGLHTPPRLPDAAVTRRRALTWLGAGAGALWLGLPARPVRAADGAPRCVLRPEQTEGPYFVDERLVRSDITSDPRSGERVAGVPLALTIRVAERAGGACSALTGARVDVWHCDSRGRYSGVRDRAFDTSGEAFLRGQQVTDAAGEVRFETIYPGAYPGRAVHIHFKVRDARDGGARELTSQIYFDEATNDRVLSLPVYAGARRWRRLRNDEDGIFQDGGEALILGVEQVGGGLAGTFDLALEG